VVTIGHISDPHVGSPYFVPNLMHRVLVELNELDPDVVICSGDLTNEGYRQEYKNWLAYAQRITAPVYTVPGNHDARNVGYVRFEETFGSRDSRLRFEARGVEVALVAVDSSKPDLDEGEIGREHYPWIEEGFAGSADLRIFACHHHLVAIPGTGRERNQVLDAGDVLALLRRNEVDLVLSGHRHVPYVWPIAGMFVVHSGTVSTLRTRGFDHPAYNLIRVEDGRIAVELRIPGGDRRDLGEYPRDWPPELSARQIDPLDAPMRGPALANE
jgi:Icc protein